MTQHPSPAGPSGSNARTAIGAIVTVLLAAVGGTAYLFTQSHSTPTNHATRPDTQSPAASQPASPIDKTGTNTTSPADKIEKSTKPKPPPADPG